MALENGTLKDSGPRKIPLRAGVYAPILTMFDADTEELDLVTQEKHAVRLVKAGLKGLVVMGSNGEAVHLTRGERHSLVSSIRKALDEAGFSDLPIIAGCTEQSTRETIALCKDASAAGASYAIILPPCYYKGNMVPDVIHKHFTDVADKSPIPILMYNFPAAVAGVDMDSDLMIRIAKHPNVKGAKLTCANTGKLTRLAAAADAISVNGLGSGFLATGGYADMVVQCMVSSASGVVAGTGNIFPRLCVKVWSLCEEGNIKEAAELQKLLADADWQLSKGAISGTKAALQAFYGYGIHPRRPLPRWDEAQLQLVKTSLAEAFKVENSLS